MKTLNHPFFLDMQRGAQDAAGPAGLDVVVQAAEREIDVEKQVQIIENLLQTGIRALIVTPSGSREIATVIAKANRANVPVIVVDTRVDPKAAADNQLKLASFIGSDNYEGGRIAGEYLAKVSGGKAKVAVLEGIPGHETGDSRLRGFRDAVGAHPGMTIVASQPANWERDQGFTVFQNMLQAHPETDALFACSDLMALGALEAIAAAGRSAGSGWSASMRSRMRGRRSRPGGWKPRSRSRRATWGGSRSRARRKCSAENPCRRIRKCRSRLVTESP